MLEDGCTLEIGEGDVDFRIAKVKCAQFIAQ